MTILLARRPRLPLLVGVALLAAGGSWVARRASVPSRLISSMPPPARVIARVGGRALTDVDLARYQRVRELVVGVGDAHHELDELCERALYDRAAEAEGIVLTPDALARESLRRRLIIGAVADVAPPGESATPPFLATPAMGARTPWQSGAATVRARGPLAMASLALRRAGVSDADLELEARADALASAAKKRLLAMSPDERAVLDGLAVRWKVERYD